MKKLALASLCLLILSAESCKKKDTDTVKKTTTAVSPYYFKGTLDGTSYNFTDTTPQYMPFNANEIGGYESADASLFPSFGLRLSWPLGDTVKESDVMGLAGKTLHYNDTLIHPEVSFTKTASATDWFSTDTANTSYNVQITKVTFLKKDVSALYNVRTYVITGTCSAVMKQGSTTAIFTGGSFSFVISRMDL